MYFDKAWTRVFGVGISYDALQRMVTLRSALWPLLVVGWILCFCSTQKRRGLYYNATLSNTGSCRSGRKGSVLALKCYKTGISVLGRGGAEPLQQLGLFRSEILRENGNNSPAKSYLSLPRSTGRFQWAHFLSAV